MWITLKTNRQKANKMGIIFQNNGNNAFPHDKKCLRKILEYQFHLPKGSSVVSVLFRIGTGINLFLGK
jgi:hypothetical protein